MSPSSPPLLQRPTSPAPPVGSSTSVDLTTWFLNAKRSLSSVGLCARANSLVDSARVALQEATVISSRCVFLRNALQDQLVFAIQINRMMHSTRDASRTEFEVGWFFLKLLLFFDASSRSPTKWSGVSPKWCGDFTFLLMKGIKFPIECELTRDMVCS